MEQKSMLLGVALLAGVACALSGMALLKSSGPPAAAAAAPDSSALHLQELTNRVAELRQEVDRQASARPADLEPAATRESLAPALPPDVLERIAGLERTVAALQKQLQERPAAVQRKLDNIPDLRTAQRAATDPRSSDQEKLAALAALRGQKQDGEDARSHEVVQSLLDLAERSADEKFRVDVYRNMHGVTDSTLRDSLLRALAGDPSVKVRMKCAEDLDTFVTDPRVVAGLKQAAEGDADAGVRAAALATLAGKR